jgi:hypothetical protein
MFVTPAPIGLLIVLVDLSKIPILAMGLFSLRAIRLIFLTIPYMIVVVSFVVVRASLLIFSSQGCGRDC